MRDPNPFAESNNKHHTEGYRYKNQGELLEEIFGKRPGDPDVHGHYPGQEPEQSNCPICNPKAPSQNTQGTT